MFFVLPYVQLVNRIQGLHVLDFFRDDNGFTVVHALSRSAPPPLARFQAKLVLGLPAANVKIRGRILFAVRGCETILFST